MPSLRTVKYSRIFVDSFTKEAPLDNAVIMPPSSRHCPQAGPSLVTVRAGGGAGLRRLSAGAGVVMPLYHHPSPLPGDAKECPRVPAAETLSFALKSSFSRIHPCMYMYIFYGLLWVIGIIFYESAFQKINLICCTSKCYVKFYQKH